MKLSVFTDEINRRSSARAIELAAAWGMSHVEVRSLDSGRFPRVPDTELEEFQRRLADAGLIVSAVSPGLFKCPPDDGEVEPGIRETLPRAWDIWKNDHEPEMISAGGFRGTSTIASRCQIWRIGLKTSWIWPLAPSR